MRTWARANGYQVSDRGRIPAQVQQAYLAANGKSRASGKPAVGKGGKAPAKTKPAPSAQPAVEEPVAPQPKPSVVSDDRRLVALGEELTALAARVAALEAKLGGGTSKPGKTTRFRRRG